MTKSEFNLSLTQPNPPPVGPLLLAMWFDAKDNWNKSHELAQEVHTPDGSWVHAYLHRKEGDVSNASYWYHRAQKTFPKINLDEEWQEIVDYLLTNS